MSHPDFIPGHVQGMGCSGNHLVTICSSREGGARRAEEQPESMGGHQSGGIRKN
uniref:Uncharacterized protein n=1 Tax=Anguilla anguilla TaxID=7936 RepID=A0A0E9R8S8_ANGAN